jgi:hypothetical protein
MGVNLRGIRHILTKKNILFGVLLVAVVPEAFAITPTQEIATVKGQIIDYATKNSAYLGMLGAGLAGTVMAFGAEVKKIIGNNLGYVGYVAFAGTAITGALTVLGITI